MARGVAEDPLGYAQIILIAELFIRKRQEAPGFLLGATSGQTHL